MKYYHVAVIAVAACFNLAACADNPVAPDSRLRSPASSSFARAERSYAFTTVDVPGAFQTLPQGINASGVIVGAYFSGSGCPSAPCVVKGFIYNGTSFTTVVYHNAAGTEAVNTQLRGIGPSGEIVGSYRMPGEAAVNVHGFILTTAGEFISADYPGHTNTIPQRILPDGTILGCYHDNDTMGSMFGFLVRKGDFSPIDISRSMHNGATPSGNTIVGLFTDMDAGKARAYVIEDGVFTPFDAPNSSGTQAWDINPSGTIVGIFTDDDAPFAAHGFVLDRGQYTTINYPGSAYTDTFGINAAGDIVGKYRLTSTGPFHGYVARLTR